MPGARQQQGLTTRLDNHDDFEGHAKRHELSADGHPYLGFGGTPAIDSPAPYSAVAKALIADLGIDMRRDARGHDADLPADLGLQHGFFFDRETFGVDRLVKGYSKHMSDEFPRAAPLTEAVKRHFARLATEPWDPMPGLTSAEKKARLTRLSYAHFLTQVWGLDTGVLPLLQTQTHGLFGVGIDAVAAQDVWGLGLPGFQGMHLEPDAGAGQGYDADRSPEAEKYYLHFPDGNATVARLLVRRLIPVAGATLDDVVTAAANYARLDRAQAAVKIRLNSTVVLV